MSKSVLVIDDIGLLFNLMESMLHRAGYEVVRAIDHRTALAQIETTTPDLIVLDVRMPGRKGYAGLAHLRQHPIPLLLLIGREHLPEELVPHGVVSYLHKPFDHHALLGKVNELLNDPDRQGF